MKYDIIIVFKIIDFDHDPSFFTEKLSITPTRIHTKGQRDPIKVIPKGNLWSIESRASSENANVEEHWHSISDKLIRNHMLINDFAKKFRCEITLVVNGSKRIPSIIIPPSLSLFAGEINSIIDIDVYQ